MPRRPPSLAKRFPELAGLAGFVCFVVFLVFCACPSCDGPGNTGMTSIAPELVRDVPWVSGGVPGVDMMGAAILPDLPVYPPIASGLPDLGSQHEDCSELAHLEFSTGWFDTFEPSMVPPNPNELGLAAGWASYDDLTKSSFHVPGDATWYPAITPDRLASQWGLPAERLPGPSCAGTPNDWVMHFRGGLFRKWGGGISHAFVDPPGRFGDGGECPATKDFCPQPLPAGATTDSAGLPLSPPGKTGDYQQSHAFFDVSAYDGIAFWARRGPEGHDQSLVILTDKFTSSRLARENQQFCRRIRECHTACLSGTPCSPDVPGSPTAIYRCYDPRVAALPANIKVDSQFDLMYPRCGPSACTSPDTYSDPDFDGKACRPYTFPAADESGEFCWNADDPPPPSRDERCQDGWQTSIALTPDWKFYALPFTQFGQVGFGKRAPYMDLKSLDVLAFGATMGWADVYFDNVTLYRRKKK